MTGQAAGLVMCAVALPPSLVLTWLGWREKRRDERRAAHVLDRDGR